MKDHKIFVNIMSITLISSVIFALIINNQFDSFMDPHGPYVIIIERNFHNESEEDLISIAENITPPDGSWWFIEFDNIHIVDCVNKEAILYYIDLIFEIEKDHDVTGFDIKNAYFMYNVTINHITNEGRYNTSCENLIEVNLTIVFGEYVNPLNAFGFQHYRCVIFNCNRDIITVKGDDVEPDVLVS